MMLGVHGVADCYQHQFEIEAANNFSSVRCGVAGGGVSVHVIVCLCMYVCVRCDSRIRWDIDNSGDLGRSHGIVP